ncbi:MAG: fibrillarin-like rRNA/tRNA 2'-O-methyltransferase [Nanoarchaeota archaeon]|nr:fibrillarin-like rRNA/tRNA 2'-O-methyltransferase [Nanoarchaeota archaeon]
MIKKSKIFEVYETQLGRRNILLTKNLVKGVSVYGERLFNQDGEEYREWVSNKSKLAAAILKGCPNTGIRKDDVVLYLGAASGTTASHVSDIVGENGFVFALDFAPRVVRDLVFVCEKRKNMAPLLEDANNPESYKDKISKEVDIVYQDVAQKNQAQIFLKNCDMFLKKEGYALLALKARSVDVSAKPSVIFKKVREEISKKLIIIDERKLEPFEMDHCMFVCKKK